MLAVIALAVGVPGVRHGDPTGFVLAYAFMQGLLTLLFLRSRRHTRDSEAERGFTTAYALGYALGGALWLVSLFVPPAFRLATWIVAMVVLMLTPVLAARRMPVEDFDAGHIAERYGSFALIVLGESVVSVAAGATATGWNAGAVFAAACGFGVAACVWWVYFDFIKASALSRRDLVPAFVWGYSHLFIFGGIAAAAAGVQLAVMAAASVQPIVSMGRAILDGGTVAYLLAIAAIHGVTVKRLDAVIAARLLAACGVAAVLGLGGALAAPLEMAMLIVVVAAEMVFEIVRSRRALVR
jgi:low temperature requirement protein LtrA